ncbi:AAA family ATPase [Candidatus Thiothrix anitrata]|uniref:AAA family ATPase n=1 Tax=Candidatus Thiothrix anitrata TaxID=2823902 RepID=A0ABX7X1K6_9GAMM|nr:ATP-binding protein [Candidatus Thiothrix anitrata]QTR49257.1 AAA family ATPase [Candidatus Thiothrix anitrata]
MITELRLENWKSFGEATLYIDPLSILIGTNASGKSNVLDALQFLQRIASGVTFSDALNSIRGGSEWATKKGNLTFSLNVVFLEKNIEYKYGINHSLNSLFVNESVSANGRTLDRSFEIRSPSLLVLEDRSDLREGFEFISIIFNILSKIVIFCPDPDSMKGYSLLSDKLYSDAGNIAGVLAALSVERQKEIEDTLTQYASRLPERDIHRVYAEKVGKLGKDAMLYCDEKWGESGEIFTVDARAMSDGTLRFLAILTALLTLPEGSLLAIDEVDNGFHPSRAHLLLEALQTIGKQRNIDVLVTTHNPALLDALGTEFVPFVTVAHRDSITGESKLTLLEDIEQLPKLLAQGTVGKLSTQGLIEKSLESVHG